MHAIFEPDSVIGKSSAHYHWPLIIQITSVEAKIQIQVQEVAIEIDSALYKS
jgi:hypothetical protein